jgi:hypothetical protein
MGCLLRLPRPHALTRLANLSILLDLQLCGLDGQTVAKESLSREGTMKSGWWIWTSTVILLAFLGPEAEAGRTLRDLSGDAMQSQDSRMMSSPGSRAPRYFSRTPFDFSGRAMQSHDSRMRSSAMRSAPRDFSGNALQSHDSRMISSPVTPFLGQFGTPSFGTPSYTNIGYPPARSMASVKVPTSSPTPPARPKFWTARCGDFVVLEASATMNLMEEEQKPCSR